MESFTERRAVQATVYRLNHLTILLRLYIPKGGIY